MARKFNPWGYAIDYKAAIAEDERALLHAEAALACGWIAPDARDWWLADLVFVDLAVRAELNLSLSDLAAIAAYRDDATAWTRHPELPEPGADAYRRGRALCARLLEYAPDSLPMSREHAARMRKLAMTRLARHRRNATR